MNTTSLMQKRPMNILITAGPTREHIDPVRFISNLSTGNMGYCIAREAKKRKHKVTLISGPVNIKTEKGIKKIDIITAGQMHEKVKKEFSKSDCAIFAAAVSDFSPDRKRKNKFKKTKAKKTTLLLRKTPDILQWAGARKKDKLIIGFCMETTGLIERAKKKLKAKTADIIIANKVSKNNPAFGKKPTKVFLVKSAGIKPYGPAPKAKVAEFLLDNIENVWYNQ